MPDYQKMYTTLFNAVTDALRILQNSQQETEEMYISSEEPIIKILQPDSDNKKEDGGCDK